MQVVGCNFFTTVQISVHLSHMCDQICEFFRYISYLQVSLFSQVMLSIMCQGVILAVLMHTHSALQPDSGIIQ